MICNRRCSLLVMVLLLLMILGNGQNECRDSYCGPNQIRYPFQLVDGMTNHSGYADFRLSCVNNTVTMLELPAVNPDPVRLIVEDINYEYRLLSTYDPENCLSRVFLKLLESSTYPFQFYSSWESETETMITFLDCSSAVSQYINTDRHPQDTFSCPIFAADSSQSVIELNLLSCTKMFELVSPVPVENIQDGVLILTWSKQNSDVENYHCEHKPTKTPTSTILTATGLIVLVLLFIALFFQIYRYFRMKGDDQTRVKMFLKDYKAFKPTRFSYADLKRITNHFKDKLGEGAHGVVFEGKLSNEILVAVKLLNNSDGDGQEFINEVGIMGKIHHVNVVRLLGFCADGFHRALVYNFFPNGSLQNFISPPDNKDIFLGWEKLQEIAIGIGKGIEYLHQGCDHQILHFDINPHNVLLDHNLAPKISDFGVAKLCSKNRSIVSMTTIRGTLGYIAPEVFSRNFGNVSHKSDIYSYGMLLLEMVAGRKNTTLNQESFQVLYPKWIHNLIEGRDTHINIEDDEGIRIAMKLAIVGLWCIQWHPENRPSMKTVIQMLEGEGDKLKVPPTPFDSTASINTSVITLPRQMNLEVIHELE